MSHPRIQLQTFDRIAVKQLSWLWPGWIPQGKLVTVDGDPGLGKSTMLLDLAARVSRGGSMPDGSACPVGGAIIATAEDNASDTVRPRLEAAGACLERVTNIEGVREARGERPLLLPNDLPYLADAVAKVEAKLLILDPFVAFLGANVATSSDHQIRLVLHQLAKFASAYQVSILLLRHLNKSEGQRALYRGSGSIGLIGAARAGLLVARSRLDPNERVLAQYKTNLGTGQSGLRFQLLPLPTSVCQVRWLGASRETPDSLVAAPPRRDELLHHAENFLREILASDPLPARQILCEAEAQCISEKTLRRAKRNLGVCSTRLQSHPEGQWLWSLPDRSSSSSTDTASSSSPPEATRDVT